MLDLAILQPPLVRGRYDIGRILETLLYYDRVHLVVSGAAFAGLWDSLGPDDLRALFAYPSVTATVMADHQAVFTNNENGVVSHKPTAIRMMGRDGKSLAQKDYEGSLLQWVSNNPNRKGRDRKEVARVMKAAKLSTHGRTFGSYLESERRTKALAGDPETLKLFIRGTAQSMGRALNERALSASQIRTFDLGEPGLVIDSAVPLADIVETVDNDINWGTVVNHAHSYASDLYLSQAYGGDIVTVPEAAEIASQRLDLSLQRTVKMGQQVSAFEEMVFDTAHPLSEAFNEGWITFSETLKIIDQSKKFRTWTRGLPPDGNLLAEYHAAISKETSLKSLPFSVARFAFFNAGGMALDTALAPGTGIGLSAIDTFIVERLIGGWRPNVFVKNLRRKLETAQAKAVAKSDRG
ncbi:hypothetical protein [Asticcacaulis sp. AND118]|uniref:hypothetical protein n=1 Tax=Asticcacaulis sp. AND118 TaxID=2840468 RepID=UPI001CFFD9E4|nr:hypothetical protein [Asticcacaulis sp. AND118]UDF04025.1 hypothetical protein LH365_02985 [Asticcacaulis sp. AND118]